ncbi:MAG: segregation/condensation protein A [Bdellovibrionales bacterium]|nr:segregation/condensation protein A [Bdellovibrionales bacterium]
MRIQEPLVPDNTGAPSGGHPLMASEFQVRLGFFAGPMDLLLHLVRRQEVSIAEVEMAKVADQYLEIIESARHIDLDVATEFLVVATTLVAIKSERVLPRHPVNDEGSELEEDPYGDLRERLRRYEIFKERAKEIRALPQLGATTFARRDRSFVEPEPESLEIDEEIQSIGFTFVRLLKRIGETVNSMRISLEPVSVVDCMMKIIDAFSIRTGVKGAARSFFELLRERRPDTPESAPALEDMDPEAAAEHVKLERRNVFIGNFIAVLELVKRGVIHVEQPRESADIQLSMCLQEGAENEQDAAQMPVSLSEKIVIIDTDAAREAWGEEVTALEEQDHVEEEVLKEVNRD